MIIVKLTGGLGNQLFQYTFGLKWARYYQTELKVDLSWFHTEHVGITPRPFVLYLFELEIEEATSDHFRQISVYLLQEMNYLAKVWNKGVQSLHPRYIKQKGLADVYQKGSIPNNSYLDGNWIAKYHVEELRPELMNRLQLKTKYLMKSDRLHQIKNSESVCLHIRRGDYINVGHFLLSIDYFLRGITRLKELISPDVKYFVFSDDIEWCENAMNTRLCSSNSYVTFIDAKVPNGEHDSYHFYLMTQCKHFIIANSTFSWWAAWLGQYPGKIVICPAKFEPSNIQHTHLILNDWIPIPVD